MDDMTLERLKFFYRKYERHATLCAFILGFLIDNLTLTRVDMIFDNVVLISYLGVAALGIILFQIFETGWMRNRFTEKVGVFLPLAIQFAFGGIFSGFVVFYSRSASFVASWPFLLLLIAVIIGNEVLKKRYSQLTFQVSIFFTALFSYSIFILPVIFGRIGTGMFILSGFAAIAILSVLLYILSVTSRERFMKSRKGMILSIGGIYLVFNLFYFQNIIPPLPLSIKELGVYHSVSRRENKYVLQYEPAPWYSPWRKIGRTFHRFGSEPVYVFSSVFAPTKLTATILHEWSYLDEKKGRWVSVTRIAYPIVGGSDGGYQGYSVKNSVFPATWRVDVITEKGQVIGRVRFRVVDAKEKPPLQTELK